MAVAIGEILENEEFFESVMQQDALRNWAWDPIIYQHGEIMNMLGSGDSGEAGRATAWVS